VCLAREVVERESGGAQAETRSLFFGDGEGDCTSEKGAGQFSIFGAVEEKSGSLISRGTQILKKIWEVRLRAWGVWFGLRCGLSDSECGVWPAGLSTGGAQEMQKGEGGERLREQRTGREELEPQGTQSFTELGLRGSSGSENHEESRPTGNQNPHPVAQIATRVGHPLRSFFFADYLPDLKVA
jgi:hypothetical protein